MFDNSTHQTVSEEAIRDSAANAVEYEGRLLQIHPVDLDGGLITIGESEFVIGRETGCSLVIAESSISRKHLSIEKNEDGYLLTDLGSTNGTFVNQQRATRCLLRSGDRIQVGGRIFKFIATDQVEAQYHEAVYSMMTKDSLTGTWNKRYFLEVLQRELKRRARSQRSFALMMVDFDHFKSINDMHSHLVGDEVLTEMARRISSAIREEDVFARYGGEEFAIMLPEVNLEDGLRVAERCRFAVSERPFETSRGDIKCTVSIGLAIADEETMPSMRQLIALADEKLYQAKESGRNRIRH